jgi:hypothetical protein
MKTTLTGAVLLAFNSLGLHCQPSTTPQSPVFEVASIKISRDPGTVPVCFVPCTGERLTVEGTRVDIRFMSLYQLIVRAYRIKLYQLSGPNWMTSQKFDILAKMPEGVSEERIPEMHASAERRHMRGFLWNAGLAIGNNLIQCSTEPRATAQRSATQALSSHAAGDCRPKKNTAKRKYLHGPVSYSSWESACPSTKRVGVRRPELFDNCIGIREMDTTVAQPRPRSEAALRFGIGWKRATSPFPNEPKV